MITNFEEYRANKAENMTIDNDAVLRYYSRVIFGECVDEDGNPVEVDYSLTEEYDKKEYEKYLKADRYKTENQKEAEEFLRTHPLTEEELEDLEEIDEAFWEERGL